MLYLNEEVPCNSFPIVLNPEIICIKSHQLKPKWLLLGCYKSHLWLTPMDDTYGNFEKKFANTHAPIKTKMIRFNYNVFTTEELRNYECNEQPNFLKNRKTRFKR